MNVDEIILGNEDLLNSPEFRDWICSNTTLRYDDIFEKKEKVEKPSKSLSLENSNSIDRMSSESIVQEDKISTSKEYRYSLYEPRVIAKTLIEKSILKYLRIYDFTISSSLYYLYYTPERYFIPIGETTLITIVHRILSQINPFISIKVTNSIFNELLHEEYIRKLGGPQVANARVFTNGVFCLDSGQFYPTNPNLFVTYKLPYPFIKENKGLDKAPHFQTFLNHFCDGHEDRIQYLRAILNRMFLGINSSQSAYLFIGPGGSGKSTFMNIITALIGKENTITSSFKTLSSDKFEASFLKGKTLVKIPDMERVPKDLEFIKRLTGEDTLMGRRKHKNLAEEINFKGNILINSNYDLEITELTGALERRIKVFHPNKGVHKSQRYNLIYLGNNGYEGPIVSELEYILPWCISMPDKDCEEIIRNMEEFVPSFKEEQENLKLRLNPLSQFIKDCLEIGGKCYIGSGFKVGTQDKAREAIRRKTLYPIYILWSQIKGIKPIPLMYFSKEMEKVLKDLNFPSKKDRDSYGNFITGIKLKDFVFTSDFLYQSPLGEAEPRKLNIDQAIVQLEQKESNSEFIEITPELSSLEKENENLKEEREREEYFQKNSYLSDMVSIKSGKSSEHVTFHIRTTNYKNQINKFLDPQLYNKYCEILDISTKKFRLESSSSQESNHRKILHIAEKDLDFHVERCLSNYLSNTKLKSEVYKEHVKQQIYKDVEKIAKYGITPSKYRQMNASPRILPLSYKDSVNSVKRIVKEYFFNLLGEIMMEDDEPRVLIDLDLKSCYTSILLGLYPYELDDLRKAIEGPGLWKFIEKEFESRNKLDVYNKPAVKICVYSSLFQGGAKAMKDGILDNIRKDIGMTPKVFRSTDFHSDLTIFAQEVAAEVSNSLVVHQFHQIANVVKERYLDQYLIGPTGHAYYCSETDFKNAYPNYLQSYESSLIMQSVINTYNECPKLMVLGHFHDGFTCSIPFKQKEEFLSLINKNLDEVRRNLHLDYPQILEVKAIYPLTKSNSVIS